MHVHVRVEHDMQQTTVSKEATRSSTVAEGPRDALCQLKSQQVHSYMKNHIVLKMLTVGE